MLARTVASLAVISLVLPACTMVLWRDNRTHEYEDIPNARAYHLFDHTEAFVVALDEAAVARLRECAPECAAATWCEVRLPSVGDAVAFFRRRDKELWLLHEAGSPPSWYVGERAQPRKLAPQAPPTRIACTVTPLAAAPASLGSEIEGLGVVDVVVHDDGTPLAVRIAATPLAMAFDGTVVVVGAAAVVATIVLSPIGLLMKGLETLCNDE